MHNICLIRSGHLGDVIMTEPTARAFRAQGANVFLATDHLQAACLLDQTYAGFIRTNNVDICGIDFSTRLVLTYELTPQLSYIAGFARSAGIELELRAPVINSHWVRIVDHDYILIAPNTSHWIQPMRNWGITNYRDLQRLIMARLEVDCILLEAQYSFSEMLSLIKHCQFLIGNDSAPNIIGQCFGKKTFTIFGATHPRYVLFRDDAVAIHTEIECLGCKHQARHTKIQCASPFCLTALSVEQVFVQIENYYRNKNQR